MNLLVLILRYFYLHEYCLFPLVSLNPYLLDGFVNCIEALVNISCFHAEYIHFKLQIVFHGICIDQKVIALDGSESPLRIVARSLLASEKLAPVATLNKAS